MVTSRKFERAKGKGGRKVTTVLANGVSMQGCNLNVLVQKSIRGWSWAINCSNIKHTKCVACRSRNAQTRRDTPVTGCALASWKQCLLGYTRQSWITHDRIRVPKLCLHARHSDCIAKLAISTHPSGRSSCCICLLPFGIVLLRIGIVAVRYWMAVTKATFAI